MDDKSYHQANIVAPEEYGRKRAQIQAARAYLEQMEYANEVGRESYEADLLKKIHEGDEARQRLLQMGHYRGPMTNAPLRIEAGPSSARIEEIPTSTNSTGNFIPAEHQGQSSSQSQYHQQSKIPTQMAPITWHSSHYNYGQQQQQASTGYPIRQPSYAQNYAPGIRGGPPPPPVSQLSQPPGYYRRNYEHYSNADNLRQSNTQKPPPSVPPPSKSSSNKTLTPTASNGIHGSGMTQYALGNRTTRQDSQKPVHYTPTGVQPVGSSSLVGALGQTQLSQPGQPSTPVSLNSVPSSSSLNETAYNPKTAQIPAAVAGSSNQGIQNAVTLEELEDRKARVLGFRSSILEWARTAPPNTYTEFFSVKAHKGPDSVLYIISRVNGQEQVEQHDTFFERLWIMAGLSPNMMPFKQTSTTQQLADKVSSGPPLLPTEPPTLVKTPNKPATRPVLPKNGVAPAVGASETKASPSTPGQQTLVDPASGKWRSPADADKKRLARDVIYALGKRKQENQSESYSKPAKRQALEAPAARMPAPERVEHMSRVISGVPQGLKQLNEPLTGAGRQTVRPDVVPAAVPGSLPIQPVQQQQQFEATPSSYSTPGRLQTNSAPLPIGVPAEPNTQKSQTAESTSISTLQDSNGSGSNFPKAVSLPELSRAVTPASQANVTLPASLQASDPAIPVEPSTNTIRAVPNTAMFSGVAVHSSTSTNDAKQQLKPSFSVMKFPVEDPNPAPSTQARVVLPSISKTVVNDVDMTSLNPDDSSNELPSPCDLDSLEPSSSKAREPLFLPSPSSSPLPLTVSKEKKKRPSVYVLVPPPPNYLIRYRRQQARKAEKAEGRSSKGSSCTSSVVSTSVHSRSSEDLLFAFDPERNRGVDPDEQAAVQLACSRLQELPCRWGECNIILNSIDSLICHLNTEHKPVRDKFTCRWTQCGRQCSTMEKHLEKHALLPLRCAYQGCRESFRSGSQLLKHFRTKHVNDKVKSPARPFLTKTRPLISLPEELLPSYLIVATPVLPFRISPERHSAIGPWILRNIATSDAEKPKRMKKPSNPGSVEEASNTYEFLNTRSTRYSWNHSEPVDMNFEDLDSVKISEECNLGLTFFGPEEDSGDEGEIISDEGRSPSPLFSSPEEPTADTEEVDVFERVDYTEFSDDEDAVQRLLMT